MITKPAENFYEYKGGIYTARDLVFLAGHNLPGSAMTAMATRMRNYIRKHGIERAMEIMKDAKPPVPRSEYIASKQKSSHKVILGGEFDEDLELARKIENLLSRGASEDEVRIKLNPILNSVFN